MRNNTRPVDIGDLLSIGKSTNDKIKILSREERQRLIDERQKQSISTKATPIKALNEKKIRTGDHLKEKNISEIELFNSSGALATNKKKTRKSKQRSKFDVEYHEEQDTTLNRTDVVDIPLSLNVNSLEKPEQKVTKINKNTNTNTNIKNKKNQANTKNKKKKRKLTDDLDMYPSLPRESNSVQTENDKGLLDPCDHKSRANMTDVDWRQFNQKYHIKTYESNIKPIRSWTDVPEMVPQHLVDLLVSNLGFQEPSTIQKCSIPNILSKKDFLGVAKTGSGKTLAYVLPILIQSLKNESFVVRAPSSCYSLILAPTRELAQQIETEGNQFSVCEFVSVVGGKSLEEYSSKINFQRRTLQGNGVLKNLVIVATPGRLIDCLEQGIVDLNHLDSLIYDEADKMIDLGFEDQLNKIHLSIPQLDKIQKIMFTATLNNKSLEKIIRSKLNDPVIVKLDSINDIPDILQNFRFIPKILGSSSSSSSSFELSNKKLSELLDFLKKVVVFKTRKTPIMIFVNYKKTADELFQVLSTKKNYKVDVIHGSKSQDQRERTLQKIRNHETDILIGTDVAARGIDIPNVGVVINYELGQNFEEYVHRIGRTGRGGNTGESLTFLCEDELNENFIRSFYKFLTKKYPKPHLQIPKKLLQNYKIDTYNTTDLSPENFIIY